MVLAPRAGDAEPPHVGAIVRHLALSLLMATVIPSVLFYVCLLAGDIWAALGAALAWCYGSMAWRVSTRRRCSALLWLTVTGLTLKTALTFATRDTFIYFLQPAVTDVVIALVFLTSLAGARPIVARLAADFYPMTTEIASRPRIQRLFWHLTLIWALLCLGQATATVWLLESASVPTFVAARTGLTIGGALLGAAATVLLASRIARSENLLRVGRRPPAVVATGGSG